MNGKQIIGILLVLTMVLSLLPVNALADDPAPTMDPKQTNELYEGLVDGLKKADLSDELKKVDFDNSLLWGTYDWSRAWLIISLCSDLKENNQSLYDRYAAKASKFYMALIPPMFSKDDPYSYQVFLLDGTNALSFYYTPGRKYCSYSEYSNIGQENIENLSILASVVWEVTEDDFNSLNNVIENGTTALTGNDTQETPKPTSTSTPKVSLSRSEIEEKVLTALVFMLMYSGDYDNYNLNASQARIDSVIETSDGWDVKGTVILYDYRNNSSSRTFRTHVDASGNAEIPKIS
ncbi:MAG: hypothetical protein IJV40_16315 [Oscillospiraceae bacterium]|nr:hypothetical protein [Oscillospiraceae bacterium]